MSIFIQVFPLWHVLLMTVRLDHKHLIDCVLYITVDVLIKGYNCGLNWSCASLGQHILDACIPLFSKIQNYSPTEAAKVYDKPLPKKALVKFNPEAVLNVIREKGRRDEKSFEEECDKLVDDYLNVSKHCLSCWSQVLTVKDCLSLWKHCSLVTFKNAYRHCH